MTTILNLTQHNATIEQAAEGVYEPRNKALIKELLTFSVLPSHEQISSRAEALADIAVQETSNTDSDKVMIGGAPFLMAPLVSWLTMRGLTPVFAFSLRESVEMEEPDGSVKKINTFRHKGFV